MNPLFAWREAWTHWTATPDDVRAIFERACARVQDPFVNPKLKVSLGWSTANLAASAPGIDDLVAEIDAHRGQLRGVDIEVAVLPSNGTLLDVKQAASEPYKKKRNAVQAACEPLYVEISLRASGPGARLEVRSASGLAGESLFDFLRPQMARGARRVLGSSAAVRATGALIGALSGFVALSLGVRAAAVGAVVLGLALAGALLAPRAMSWLFPPLELRPDRQAPTRWRQTLSNGWKVAGALVALVGLFFAFGTRDDPRTPQGSSRAEVPEQPLPSSDATKVGIDTVFSARRYSGPGGVTEFKGSVKVQYGNVVQWAMIGHNIESPSAPSDAQDFRFHLVFPTRPQQSLQATAAVSASNSVIVPGYKSDDGVVLEAPNGEKIYLGNFRNIQLQRNVSGSVRNLEWGELEDVPYGRIQAKRTDEGYFLTVQPTSDGRLTSRAEDILRIVFLADVH